MRDILYKYNTSGMYTTEDNTAFAGDSHLKLIVEPHEFSIAIGKEVLRSSSFSGCVVVASCDGEVVFYDKENNIFARADKSEKNYEKVLLKWKQNLITIQFGHIEEVDYYPNCDGEHDRWGEEWITQRSVTLNLKDNSIEVA